MQTPEDASARAALFDMSNKQTVEKCYGEHRRTQQLNIFDKDPFTCSPAGLGAAATSAEVRWRNGPCMMVRRRIISAVEANAKIAIARKAQQLQALPAEQLEDEDKTWLTERESELLEAMRILGRELRELPAMKDADFKLPARLAELEGHETTRGRREGPSGYYSDMVNGSNKRQRT